MSHPTWSFEFYYSLPFWAALAVVVIGARLLGSWPRAKDLFLVASSCLLLLAIPRFGVRELALVLGFSIVTYVFVRALTRLDPARASGLRRALAVLGVLAIVAFLCVFKYPFLQDLLMGRTARSGGRAADFVFLLGVSYFSFKAIHSVVEAYKGSLVGVDGGRFLNYMTFFPSFISGPIARYNQFTGPVGEGKSTLREDLQVGGRRIVDGLFKKFVLVTLLFPYALQNQAKPLAQMSFLDAVVGLYACSLYFYFDFAGYSDLAIGSARLMGLPLPENFNWPFRNKNIRDLWSNWHMSLTGWLIDYVYWPVVRKLRNVEFFRPRPVLLSIVGMNVTFIACGMWHGESPHFILWGAYHGLGISALNLYQRQKRKIRSKLIQRYFASRYSRWVGMFATFNFFAAGLALFVLDIDKLRTLLSAVVR